MGNLNANFMKVRFIFEEREDGTKGCQESYISLYIYDFLKKKIWQNVNI